MRRCRYRACRREFWPPKPNYWFCSWEHHQLHHAANDSRGYSRQHDQSYDRGFWDGARAKPSEPSEMPVGIWKGLLLFSHPDKWQREPGLLALAGEVTRWLLDHRPSTPERN
jgi:hypothetical protein